MERRPPEELTELARQVWENRLYVAWSTEQLDNSFGAILALAGPTLTEEADQIGLVFEDMNKAGTWAVNGMPSFLSCQLMHVADVPFFVDEMKRLGQALGRVDEEGRLL